MTFFLHIENVSKWQKIEVFFIYVKMLLYFFQNFYILIEGFEAHSLKDIQEKYLWKYNADCVSSGQSTS